MDEKLAQEIIRAYGTQCEKVLDEIDKRLAMAIAALCYAGNVGDNPLAKLNRIFEANS